MIADTRSSWGYSIGRRTTRRWIVIAYWIAIVAVLAAFVRHSLAHNGVFASPGLFKLLFFFPVILGGVRAGGAVKRFRGVHRSPMGGGDGTLTIFRKSDSGQGINPADGALDERETRERNRVHFTAYTVGRWLGLGLFAVSAGLDLWRPVVLIWMAPLFLFLLVLTMWSLPQSLILWNEPDLEAEQ